MVLPFLPPPKKKSVRKNYRNMFSKRKVFFVAFCWKIQSLLKPCWKNNFSTNFQGTLDHERVQFTLDFCNCCRCVAWVRNYCKLFLGGSGAKRQKKNLLQKKGKEPSLSLSRSFCCFCPSLPFPFPLPLFLSLFLCFSLLYLFLDHVDCLLSSFFFLCYIIYTFLLLNLRCKR